MKRFYFAFALSFAVCLSAAAQDPPASKAPDLALTAVGRQHHTIKTSSTEAQDFFDQGLTLIYGFNHEEAARAFQRAAELDPASPMPLWGIALAIGPNYNADVDPEREKIAYETIQKAKSLSEHSPQSEKDYVAALTVRYSGDANPDYKKLGRDYATAMKQLAEKYPDDLDAATMYAESLMDLNPWRLWSPAGQPGENTAEIVRVLESVLKRNPEHAGANHYYIHAVEASDDAQRALPSAQRLEKMVPGAGHLVHMPAHIYIRTGDYDAAVVTNVAAVKADEKYAKEAEKEGSIYDLMYHSHNEHFIAMAASMAGRYADAKAAADALSARLLPHAKMMPMIEGFVFTPLWVDARFGKWDAISARPEPDKEMAAIHLMWRYTRTLAFAAQGQREKAAAEKDLFAKESDALPATLELGLQNPPKAVFAIAMHVLEARIAGAAGNREEAIAHFRKAVELQDALNYDEPADWYYPVRESLGATLLAAGYTKEAERIFRDDLRRNPRNPRSLFGLRESLKAQHRDADAEWVEREFKAAWAGADTKLELKDL